jgi:tRNA (guanine10-N2)-dimethyltransferase
VPQFFFLLSGEHKTLPFAELKAVLEAERIAFKELKTYPQVLQLDTTVGAIDAIKRRAALTRVCCRELFRCEASFTEIVEAMRSVSFDDFLHQNETFVVRIRRVGESARHLEGMALERKLGELILNDVQGAKVNLKNPKRIFFGTMTSKYFFLGVKIADIPPAPFVQRRPRKRPFFHPSAMPAKLARCMVNLARARRDDLVLDPFCGTGTFLIEASLIGCRVVGLDAKRQMVRGSLQNLKFFNREAEGVVVADAKQMPLINVDCVVTDPPYGRSSSTMGYTTKEIVQDFLEKVNDKIAEHRRICISAPRTISIEKVAEKSNLKQVQSHFVYVHRSLTREIAVLEKE